MENGDQNGEQGPLVPLGVPGLDRRLGGGIPQGTSLLVIGSFGSGYREFLRTAAIMHGNWQAESGLFDLEYGEQAESLHQPAEVRYFSITESETGVHRGLSNTADSEWVGPAIERITCSCFAEEFAELGPVKLSSGVLEYKDGTGDANEFRQFFRDFGESLLESRSDSFLILDAISDFLPVALKYLDWADLYFISQTLNQFISSSTNILIAGADVDILDRREQALLRRTFENVLDFEWFGEGDRRRRAMSVTRFPRFCRQTGIEQRTMFDVDLDRGYFGLSDMEKIPSARL